MLALLFFLAKPALSTDKKGSLGLDVDAAKNYLAVQGSASWDIDSSLLSSVGINYENSRSSGVKAMETTISLDDEGEVFFGGLSFSYGNDDQTRSSLGAKLNFGANWEYSKGYDATLTLSGGPTRFSASESVSNSAAVLPVFGKRSNSDGITQWNPGVDLSLGFFSHAITLSGTYSDFRYQNYVVGSGLAGTATKDSAAASLSNTMMSGFADWQWSVGVGAKLPWKFSLNLSYAESLDLDTQRWSRSVAGNLSRDFGESFHGLVGLTHALAGGSSENTVRVGLNWDF